jgi:hypothetical protein
VTAARPRLRPWVDPGLSVGQRVAAALDAGLVLGERLATISPGTAVQAAYAAGWEDSWRAAEHHAASEWRQVAATVRRAADRPSHAELVRRRGQAAGTGAGEVP